MKSMGKDFGVKKNLILKTSDAEYGVQQCSDISEIVEFTLRFKGNDDLPEIMMSFTREQARAFANLVLEYCDCDTNFMD